MTDRQIHIRKFIHVVSKLVDEGYSVEELAKKLQVSTEEVQAELDRYRNFQIDPSMITKYENSNTTMDRIRCAYLKKYFSFSTPSTRSEHIEFKSEPEKVQEKMKFIEEQIKKGLGLSGKEFYDCYSKIFETIIEIEDLHISLEDCYTLQTFIERIPDEEHGNLNKSDIKRSKRIITKHFLQELSKRLSQVSSPEELEAIYNECIKHKVDNHSYKGLLDLVQQKLLLIKHNRAQNRMYSDISPQMHKAIHGLLDGSLTPDEAKKIINPPKEPTQASSQSTKPKVRIKIRSEESIDRTKNLIAIVGKRGDLYPIYNPMSPEIMDRFCEFIGGKTKLEARVIYINMVFRNLCYGERFDDAIEFLNANNKVGKDISDEQITINRKVIELRKTLARREIGALLLERIRHKISDEDDKETLDMIFKKMTQYKISEDKRADFFSSVKLGTDQLGISNINLGQVFPKERIYGDY